MELQNKTLDWLGRNHARSFQVWYLIWSSQQTRESHASQQYKYLILLDSQSRKCSKNVFVGEDETWSARMQLRQVIGILSTVTSDLAFSILLFQVPTCSPWGRNHPTLRISVRAVMVKKFSDSLSLNATVTETAVPSICSLCSLDTEPLTFSWVKWRLWFPDTTAAEFWTMGYKRRTWDNV